MAKIRESEIKNKICREYFDEYDWTRVIGDIDLAVCSKSELGEPSTTFLWAETKAGKGKDIYASFIQLIITIGKARTFELEMPPYFLGAADAEKIAFVEFSKLMPIFYKTDFNWNVTPSDHTTKEFRELYELLHETLSSDVAIFKYAFEGKSLRSFIKKNFKEGKNGTTKIPVGKNNFTFVYYDWVNTVKDSILVNWEDMKKANILDCDFFLADLMSKDGMSIKEKLKVVLEKTKYKVFVKAELGEIFGDTIKEFSFKDDQKAYNRFWNKYERPPKPVYQKYILERHDLLVPQDIREVKGSYYTPEPWVRLSQDYIAKTLGEDWQDEYYVWDCAAGSGNLLRGLTNRYNIYASTLDDSDVKIMHDAIDTGRLNLVKENVFQFDFLNDGYTEKDGNIVSNLINCEKIPNSLRNIIADPEKRKRLVLYINAPYKEATNGRTSAGTGHNNTGATKGSKTWKKYSSVIGAAANELFAQFTIRIAKEIPSCVLAEFSTLKILQAPNFSEFRRHMLMELKSLYLMPGDTFDNVKGQFPIGFQIYQTNVNSTFEQIEADVYTLNQKTPVPHESKTVACYDNLRLINSWAGKELRKKSRQIGWIKVQGNDFQNCNYINIYSEKPVSHNVVVVVDSLFVASVYHAVRHIPESNWLNDRDQFLAPSDSWAGDIEFQTDCLVWSIFNNNVKELKNTCEWIPFYEDEVNAPAPFNSRFMADFLHGKIERNAATTTGGDIFERDAAEKAAVAKPIDALTQESKAVLDSGREIWKYYMSKPGISANASFLDIRAYFQGFKVTGKGKRMMNSSSDDEKYTTLLQDLRLKIKALEANILPKVYEHGFLLK